MSYFLNVTGQCSCKSIKTEGTEPLSNSSESPDSKHQATEERTEECLDQVNHRKLQEHSVRT